MVVGEKKVFRQFKRKQNRTGEGSREWLLCFSAGIKGRDRDESLYKTEKKEGGKEEGTG